MTEKPRLENDPAYERTFSEAMVAAEKLADGLRGSGWKVTEGGRPTTGGGNKFFLVLKNSNGQRMSVEILK